MEGGSGERVVKAASLYRKGVEDLEGAEVVYQYAPWIRFQLQGEVAQTWTVFSGMLEVEVRSDGILE